MNAITEPQLFEPEDLLRMPDGHRFELIDGRLRERRMGGRSSLIGAEIIYRLQDYVRPHRSGHVFDSEAGYQCFPHRPRQVRFADASFIRRGRLPGEVPFEGHTLIAPDLAVEVVSPNDNAQELEEKLQDYFSAGVPLVWVFYPRTRTVYVYQPDGSARWLNADQELTGEPVLPGFRCRVGDLFPPPAPAEPEEPPSNGPA